MTSQPGTGARRPCRPLTPRQRGAVRQALAAELGDGHRADRHQVAVRLFGAPAATPPDDAATTPGEPVSIVDAATRLGVSVATVRRYLAPSSGKLTRHGTGVSARCLEALAAAK